MLGKFTSCSWLPESRLLGIYVCNLHQREWSESWGTIFWAHWRLCSQPSNADSTGLSGGSVKGALPSCLYPHAFQQWGQACSDSRDGTGTQIRGVGGNKMGFLFFLLLFFNLQFCASYQWTAIWFNYDINKQHNSHFEDGLRKVPSAENHVLQDDLLLQVFCICESKEGRR